MIEPIPLPNLQDLLAPTWAERARAEDALQLWLLRQGYSIGHYKVLPDEIVPAIEALSPSPAVFLPALVAFWADVLLQQRPYNPLDSTMPPEPPSNPTLWASPHSALFPMTPATPPQSAIPQRGRWVWYWIALLLPWADLMKQPLLGCLHHPRAHCAAKRVLSACPVVDDDLYRALLAAVDRDGPSEPCPALAAVIRHTRPHRLAWLMDGLALRPSDAVIAARFAVLGALPRPLVAPLYPRLLSHLRGMARTESFLVAIYALYGGGNGPTEPAFVEGLLAGFHSPFAENREAVVFALAALDPCRYESLLRVAMATDPMFALNVTHGLRVYAGVPTETQQLFPEVPRPQPAPGARAGVPDSLLRQLAQNTLGWNFWYGEPCITTLNVLATLDNAAVVLPELGAWLSTETLIDDAWLTTLERVISHIGEAASPLWQEVARLRAAQNDPELRTGIDMGPPTAAQAECLAQAADIMDSSDNSQVEQMIAIKAAERAEYDELYRDQPTNPFANP